MATLKDIAKILVERHQIKDGASSEFLQQMVGVINEGLLRDRIVKIKGFGTFKLLEVEERKSVNVNTGEPVIIASHDKVTFTPDVVMRDLVNKPFAQFETVIIGEQPDVSTLEPELVPTPKPNPVVEPIPDSEPVSEPETVQKMEPVPVAEPVPTPDSELQPAPTQEPEPEAEENEVYYDEEPKNGPSITVIIIINVVVAAVFFALGYVASHNYWFESPSESPSPAKTEVKKVSVKKVEVKKDTANVTKTEMANTVAKPAEAASSENADLHKYDSDPRVKYGAYFIVGTDCEVTVRKGETLEKLAKRYFGSDMVCYVQAYNGVKNVKEGDKIKIPKLKLKKRVKREKK